MPNSPVDSAPLAGRLRRGAVVVCALIVGASLAGCGPKDDEVAASVLIASPLAFAASLGILALLYSFEVPPKPRWSLWPAGIALGATFVASIAAATLPEGDAGMRFLSITLYLFGSSLMTLIMVVWAIFRYAGARRFAYVWSWILPLLVTLTPAVVVLERHEALGEWVAFVWVTVGWFGVPAVLLFAVLVVAQILMSRNSFGEVDQAEVEHWTKVARDLDDARSDDARADNV